MKLTNQYLLASSVGVLAIAAIAFVVIRLPLVAVQQTDSAGLTMDQIETGQAAPADTDEVLIRTTSFKAASSESPGAKELVPIDQFLSMLRAGRPGVEAVLGQIDKNWDINYVPIMLEVSRFLPPSQRSLVLRKLETKTGQRFGADFDSWMQWTWKQKFEPHPNYALFKSNLYSKIDPRFSEYFVKTEGATIRLDEVRWGGVRRDGIPPLKNPKMLTVAEADYLADTDVVFGIDLNGDARCYPKRILAWHEMFKDTIGGESVCGVY